MTRDQADALLGMLVDTIQAQQARIQQLEAQLNEPTQVQSED